MPKPSLISIQELVSSGWKQYVRDWKRLLEISIRFLFAGIVQLAFAMVADRLSDEASVFLLAIGSVIGYAIIFHTIITLIDYLLRYEAKPDGKLAIRWKRGMDLFWPYIWITILVTLATIGGLFLFVLPGIWLSVLFAFAAVALIDENRTGTQALARSAELVRGRWWKTLWRILVPTIVIVLITLVTSLVLTAFVGLFSGGLESATEYLGGTDYSPLRLGIGQVLDSLVSIAIIPLTVIYQIKLYFSLKKTL